MFNDKNSLQVKKSGGNYINLGNYITEAKFIYPKIWGKDAGRNLSGKQTGTLIGVFPKIVVQFRKLTQDELELIVPILDAPRQTLKYYDPFKKTSREMATYTGDYEITNKLIIGNGKKNDGFQISFIAIDRRV